MPAYSKYSSKDYVIQGSMLELDADVSWGKIHKRMRTAIRKARSFGVIAKQAQGNKDDIKKFYSFCPSNREDLPLELNQSRQWMFFAYIADTIVGGIIVTEVDGNLFLHFNAVTEAGRKKQVSSFLIWHIVETFHNSKYKFLDIGASYKSPLQDYFSGWATKHYPVIMRPPECKPQITICPFGAPDMQSATESAAASLLDKKFQGREYTIFPRGMFAIYALFKWLKLEGRLSGDDEVCISTTSGSPYISSCVTSAIEQSCKWSSSIGPRTKIVLVIHEFGFLNKRVAELAEFCKNNNLMLIEDCAYAWHSGKAGAYGDYVIYSLTKFFPMQFGGILVGKKFEYQYMWDTFACADLGKEQKCLAELATHIPHTDEYARKRVENFRYLEGIFGTHKIFFELGAGETPGAYILKVENEDRMRQISSFVRSFGIECGNYYHNNAIFLPVHQNLTHANLDYIAGSVRAMYREGCGL